MQNNYTIRFNYAGQIRDDMQGFFHINYTDSDGNVKFLALTQSQRTNARSIFPCFDEPALKATFRLQISRPSIFKTVFNAELVRSVSEGNGRALDRFSATPPMSTYLVAFMLSELESDSSGYLTTIIRPGYVDKIPFAYQVTARAINAFEELTQQNYNQLGLPLMQIVGSPIFPHTGMENWGLVIYKEEVLINEPGYSDGWSDKQLTLNIITHEMAHMWFGNSVTMAWWSYFWLNEAFGRYYEYFMAHKLFPEYQLDQQFVVEQLHVAFGIDAISSTQPLTSTDEEIQSPSEIDYKFSTITYKKGATIVRMIANLMGHDNFENAIRAYLKAFHLKSTTPKDLFTYLKRHWPTTPEVDLDQFFYDWTEQIGFPVLYVSVGSKGKVKLTQKRFLLDSGDGSNHALTYTIPITYATDAEPDFNNLTARFYFLKTNEMSFKVPPTFKWIIFNVQQSNYYRVFYDKTTLQRIKAALLRPDHSGIPTINRAQLVDDLFNFARVGMLNYTTVFNVLEYLKTEIEYLPWYAAFTNLNYVAQHFTLQQQSGLMRFLNTTLAKVYAHLAFTDRNIDVLDIYNRNKVISWACRYKLFECDNQARDLFDKLEMDGEKPSPDFRETLYCSVTREGDFAYYQTLNNWFDDEKVESEKKKLIRAMGCTRIFLRYHFDNIVSGNIPTEYALMGITPMYAENPENVQRVFLMITASIEALVERIGGWEKAANLIGDIAKYFTTQEQRKMLEDFVKENGSLFGDSIPALHHTIYTVDSNLKWSRSYLSKLFVPVSKPNVATVGRLSAVLLITEGFMYRFCNIY
ncbi:unnamed protein product [Ceratitis capitata]|uniref:Aminopeptidase n=1 Tax=Ceratitis capitata TaxID=7213 RepID=A0A811UD23_CERCA|nr:unnamed protein product [Ceratitis capitata]